MWKYTPERDARAELIKALKRGNKSLAYSLREEAGIKGEEILCVFYARGIETPEGREIIAKFEQNEKLRVMKVAEGEETYGIILTPVMGTDEDMAGKRSKCNDLFNQLKAENAVHIFNVIGIEGIESAADAYRLISETWSFVESVFPYKRVFTKYEMVLVSSVSFIPAGNSVYILGLFLFQSHCGLDLLGEILAVIIVNWRNIEKRLGYEVYFTDPYCAWQKGTNENSNGLLREFYPKGRNLSRVAPATLKRNLALINARPRKVLNFRSAQDL